MGMVAAESEGMTMFEPTGCSKCFRTGFHGRTGVFEVIEFGEPGWDRGCGRRHENPWSHAISEGRSCDLLRAAARKVAQGVTTIDEVRRIIQAPSGMSMLFSH